ncbi:LOW QUALITY PROTEIN: RNA-binding protein 12 [Bufo bufo]|uniref:LOW QUALITY PROTEIN: RNA-binding protein 12 n=1 Tax=Bufo bufo TaxID=8384 RepID=UPI001ABE8395|nr:LOW QUALITY PROTEIN: RNA-binding protein 12 [Bufo bufo]
MAVVIRLQGLPIVAGTMDIRHFFSGLTIPDGGVHIVGGEQGEAFIVFATDEDARLGMMRTGGTIKGSKVSLLLSSKTEMQNMIELSRRRFETASVDIPPANSSRPGPPPNPTMSTTPVMSRVSMPTTVPNYSSPPASTVSTVTSAVDSSKSVATFSTANVGNAPQSLGGAFCNPTFTSPMPSVAPQLPSVPPPPMPPMPSVPTLPPMPSMPPMPVPPPVSSLPPVPPIPPIPPVPPVPPMSSLPPLTGIPQLNPPPVGPLPAGMNGSGSQMNSNINPLFLGPVNPIPLSPQNSMKPPPPPLNHDDPYVALHGLPIPVLENDIKEFLRGLRIDGLVLLKDHMGRPTGGALVKLLTPHDTYEALKRNRMLMGHHFIEVNPASERQWVMSGGHMGKHSAGHHGPLHMMQPPMGRSKSPNRRRRSRSRSPHEHGFCIYLKGLPYEAENKHVVDFFKKLDIIEDSIYIAYGPGGKATGEGFLEFRNENDFKTALNRHKQYMGNRFIQVHPVTKSQMIEKIDSIRKKMQSFNYVDHKDLSLEMEHRPRLWGHLSNLPYNISRKDVFHFFNLEGVAVEENSVHVLIDNNGQGLGQALVKFRSEDDARKSERLNRKKLNGRDAFLRVVSNEERKDIEVNPPIIGRKGFKMQNYSNPPEALRSSGDEFSFINSNINDNDGQNFLMPSKFSGPSSTFAPPLPPPAMGIGFVDPRPPPPGASNVKNSPIDPPEFVGGPSHFNAPPTGFAAGPPPFGSGPANASAPPNFNTAPPNIPGSPGGMNPPPGFGPGGNLPVSGPPGFGNGSAQPGPTVIRIQNMPFTVTVDEILDFFYGYQLIPGSVCLKYSEKGMPTGEAMVAFESRDEAMAAVVDLNDRPMGSRKVKLVLG